MLKNPFKLFYHKKRTNPENLNRIKKTTANKHHKKEANKNKQQSSEEEIHTG